MEALTVVVVVLVVPAVMAEHPVVLAQAAVQVQDPLELVVRVPLVKSGL